MIKDRPVHRDRFWTGHHADKKIVAKYNAMLDERHRLQRALDLIFTIPHIYLDIAARLGLVGLLIFFLFRFNYFPWGGESCGAVAMIFSEAGRSLRLHFSRCGDRVFESFLGLRFYFLYIQGAHDDHPLASHGREQAIGAPI